MTITVELNKNTADQLARLARQKNLTINAYVQSLIQEQATQGTKEVSLVEFKQALDAFAADLPDLPSLPADFSKADLYDDHD